MPKLNLENRRSRMFLAGGAVVIAVLAWMLTEGPRDAYARSKTQLRAAKSNLLQAKVIHAEVVSKREAEKQLREMLRSRGGFDLWTFLKGIVADMKLDERGARVDTKQGAMQSSKLPAVQLQLQGVSTQELVDILYRIQSGGNPVILHSVQSIQPATNGKGLDCILVFLSPRV